MFTLAIGTDVAGCHRGGGQPVTPAPVLQDITLGTPPPRVGQLLRCTVTSTAASPAQLSYQWLLDGTAISGATAASVTPAAGSEGRRISCRVTITTAGGTATGESASFTILSAPLPAVLVIVAGQSNAQAASTSGATAPAAYATLTDAWMWVNSTGVFAKYAVGANTDDEGTIGNWGSEAEFIRQMNLIYPGRTVYVVKKAVNGSWLAPAVGGNSWSPTQSSGLFRKLETEVAAARTALSLAGVNYTEVTLFNQGEADTQPLLDSGYPTGTRGDNYKTSLTAFLTAYRTRVSSQLFVIERIRPYSVDLVARPYVETYKVRRAQEETATEQANMAIISLDFDPSNFGELHPGTAWVQQKGLRCFSVWNGDYARDFGAVNDTVPLPFTFDTVTGAEPSTLTVSGDLAVQGIGRGTPIAITGGEYRVRNPDNTEWFGWTTAPGTINPFQKAQLRLTSSASSGGNASATLTIGGVSASWTVSTRVVAPRYEAETSAFLSRMAALAANPMPTAQIQTLDAFFVTAKASSWWPKVRRLYVGGLHDEHAATIDLRDQTTLLTQASNVLVTWGSKIGWGTGAASGAGLDLRFNPAAGLPAQSVALFLWCNDFSIGGTSSSSFDMQSADLTLRLRQNDAGNLRACVNTTVFQTRTPVSATPGFRCVSRTAEKVTTFYDAAGAVIAPVDQTTTGNAVTATSLFLFAPGSGSTSARRIQVAGVSEGLSGPEVLGLRNALAALGAGFWLA